MALANGRRRRDLFVDEYSEARRGDYDGSGVGGSDDLSLDVFHDEEPIDHHRQLSSSKIGSEFLHRAKTRFQTSPSFARIAPLAEASSGDELMGAPDPPGQQNQRLGASLENVDLKDDEYTTPPKPSDKQSRLNEEFEKYRDSVKHAPLFLLFGVVFIFIIIIIISTTSHLVIPDDEEETNSPPSVPTTFPTSVPTPTPPPPPIDPTLQDDPLFRLLEPHLLPQSVQNLQTPQTPQYNAFLWLKNDTLTGSGGDIFGQRKSRSRRQLQAAEKLLQRYVLAVMVFASSSNNGTPLPPPPTWLTAQNECNWDGLTCNTHGELSHIVFPLSSSDSPGGTLPVLEMEVGLGSVEWLEMRQSLWQGVIPVMPQLTYLDLSRNHLNGPLDNLAELTNLKELKLERNQFVGSVWLLAGLTSLEVLDLSQNLGLNGPLPDLESLSFLREIDLRSTGIAGVLPDAVCDTAEQFGGDENGDGGVEDKVRVNCERITCRCCCGGG